MPRHDQVEGFILAGGESGRMGRDKALLELGGITLLERTAQLIEPLLARIAIVGPAGRYAAFSLREIPDDAPGIGPLGAIATSLRHSTGEWNLIVACDLPYLTADWLDFLIGRALASRADALVPHTEGGPEPLCAMYRTTAGAAVAAALERGVRKITDGLAGLQVGKLSPVEWKEFDSAGRLFKNMNSRAEYDEARAWFDGPKR
jgi:molybdopterin-guanine dinucleotide biosynthesis protein A